MSAGDKFVKPSVRKGVLPSILAALIQVCPWLYEAHIMPRSPRMTGVSVRQYPPGTDACDVSMPGALCDKGAAEGGPRPGTPGDAGQPAESAQGALMPLRNLKNNYNCVSDPVSLNT